jgi:hypothetical protein
VVIAMSRAAVIGSASIAVRSGEQRARRPARYVEGLVVVEAADVLEDGEGFGAGKQGETGDKTVAIAGRQFVEVGERGADPRQATRRPCRWGGGVEQGAQHLAKLKLVLGDEREDLAHPCNPECFKPAAAFSRTGELIDRGLAVKLSGPVTCPAGDTVSLRATISQRSTGAVAQGSWSKVCTGPGQQWHTTASVTDDVTMSAGCAHAAGLATIRHAGKPVDAFQWLRTVTLQGTRGAGAAAVC